MLNFIKLLFLHLLRSSCDFIFFILLMWYITLDWFSYVEPSLHPMDKSHWINLTWYRILYYSAKLFFSGILFRIFVPILWMLVCRCFLFWCLFLALIFVLTLAPIKWVWTCSLHLTFGGVWRNDANFFL